MTFRSFRLSSSYFRSLALALLTLLSTPQPVAEAALSNPKANQGVCRDGSWQALSEEVSCEPVIKVDLDEDPIGTMDRLPDGRRVLHCRFPKGKTHLSARCESQVPKPDLSGYPKGCWDYTGGCTFIAGLPEWDWTVEDFDLTEGFGWEPTKYCRFKATEISSGVMDWFLSQCKAAFLPPPVGNREICCNRNVPYQEPFAMPLPQR